MNINASGGGTPKRAPDSSFPSAGTHQQSDRRSNDDERHRTPQDHANDTARVAPSDMRMPISRVRRVTV